MRWWIHFILITVLTFGIACSDPDASDADGDTGTDAGTDASSPVDDTSVPEDTDAQGDTGGPEDTGDDTDGHHDTGVPEDTGDDTGSSEDVGEAPEIEEGALNETELELYESINEYRDEEGLEPVPLSYSLTIVARTHVQDLIAHGNEVLSGECNMHSWSDHGDWTSCCYTPDHAEAQCMWDKPGELTNYPAPAFEISSGTSSPQGALNSWKSSQGHRAVILNEGQWADYEWRAMGIGIDGGYAHVWFGTAEDPDDF